MQYCKVGSKEDLAVSPWDIFPGAVRGELRTPRATASSPRQGSVIRGKAAAYNLIGSLDI